MSVKEYKVGDFYYSMQVFKLYRVIPSSLDKEKYASFQEYPEGCKNYSLSIGYCNKFFLRLTEEEVFQMTLER